MEWNIMVANEASTGLYYSQAHNKSCILKKIKSNRQGSSRISKNKILLEQMLRTIKELNNIASLNSDWTFNMNMKV